MSLKDPNYSGVDQATAWMMRGFKTELQTEFGLYIPLSQKGAASGVASLNGSTKVVEDPANAQAAAAEGKIPIGGAGGYLSLGWLHIPYVHVREEQASGTDGGTFEADAWRTRVINTEVSDDDGLCSIASNQITLAAGKWQCHIQCPARDVGQHMARLRNMTAGTNLLYSGSMRMADGTAVGLAVIVGQFTLAAPSALEIQHRCNRTDANDGFGQACGFGVNEIYTVAEFWKVV
jgi:hypothetical protein